MTWMNRATSPRWAAKVKIETGRTRAGGGGPEIPIPDAVPGNGGQKKGESRSDNRGMSVPRGRVLTLRDRSRAAGSRSPPIRGGS